MLVCDHQCTAMATPLAAAKLRQSTQNPCRTLSIQLHSTQLLHILIIVTQASSFFLQIFFSLSRYTQLLHCYISCCFLYFHGPATIIPVEEKRKDANERNNTHSYKKKVIRIFKKKKKKTNKTTLGVINGMMTRRIVDIIIFIQANVLYVMAGYIRACKNVVNV